MALLILIWVVPIILMVLPPYTHNPEWYKMICKPLERVIGYHASDAFFTLRYFRNDVFTVRFCLAAMYSILMVPLWPIAVWIIRRGWTKTSTIRVSVFATWSTIILALGWMLYFTEIIAW